MRREIGIIGIICCIGGAFALGWFIPALIPEEEPSPEVPKIPERPKEPEIPEEPQEPEEVEEPPIPLVDEIKARGYINVGTSADYPPFENLTYSTGEIIGFDIDLSALIAAELNVTLQMTDIPFDSLITACVSGTVDMIAAAMSYNPSRATVLAPSITYINVSQVVIVKNNSLLSQISSLDNLTTYTVGCQMGSIMQYELEALGMIIGIDLIIYASAATLISDLIAGGIDAAYVEEPIFTAWSNTEALRVIFSTVSDSLVLWCRWEEPELQYVINKVIFEAYQTGTIYDLMMTWFG